MSAMTAPRDARDKVNVLLVDDEPGRLLTYEAILAELGQNLVTASSGLEALERLMRDEYAVILLDVSMPNMDGFETAALIHQHPRFEHTPIIFVTALHVTDLDRLKGYELGAVDYVYVPVVPSILRSKVAVLVELYQKRRELQRLNETLARANAELAEANSTLQAEKNRELERMNQVLEAANARLAEANATLHAEMAERERLARALQAADRRKDEFLAMLAHELRNPLAPLRNALVGLRRPDTTPEQQARCFAMMSRQITQMARLIDELIDISRITSGRVELHLEPVELKTILDDAIELARPLIEQRRHRLDVQAPANPLELHADGTRVAQVLSNLLNNAAKYTEPGGAIELTTGVEGDELVFSVRDSGIGIDPAMLGTIFDLFVQVDQSFERSQGGLGIGLTLARRLAELHDGSVEARSAGLGHGSEFVVRLPIRRPPAVAHEEDAPAPHAHAAHRTIVVADDNEDYAESCALILRMEGHDVHVAHDGLETVDLVASVRPDIVLLDIGLPKLDGYGAARRIRAMEGLDDLLLVAITGWGQPRDRRLAEEAGFDEHLVKPVDPDALLALIASYRGTDAGRATGTAPAQSAQRDFATAADAGARVLVVDDNAAVQAAAADLLRDAGYEVATVGDGHAALERAAEWHPRYVLIDTNMPLMNGFEVARRLRASHAPAAMRLIMMSGMTLNDAVRKSAASAGFDGCIDKMAEPEQWIQVLRGF